MSLCVECGKTLASPAGLRRHVNSQHRQDEWHICECGKRFLDPAGRSRCRAGHSRSFGCPLRGCRYQSSRKDCVKQHMRRRHQDFAEHPVVTLPLKPGSSMQSSSDESGLDPSPSPDQVPTTPSTLQQQLEPGNVWPPQQTLYYAEPSSQSWNWYGQPVPYNLLPTFAFSPPFLHIAPVSMHVPAKAAV